MAARAHTRISAQTGLATDFLNQFNELLMMLDALCESDPDWDWVCDWRPASYPEHFARSGFSDVALLLEGYALAEPDVRALLHTLTARLEAAIVATLRQWRSHGLAASGVSPALLAADMRAGLSQLSALINGANDTADQDAIDALFA